MTDEQLMRLKVYGNNVQRYRRLLNGNLTEEERQFVERRLTEEQTAIQRLRADASYLAPQRRSEEAASCARPPFPGRSVAAAKRCLAQCPATEVEFRCGRSFPSPMRRYFAAPCSRCPTLFLYLIR